MPPRLADRLGRLLILACLAVAPVARPAPSAGTGLLDLPFEDLLQVEIRSAGKREEQLRDIPASVTIVTREEIARYGWVTLEDLLRNVPGFFILDNTEERFIGTRGAVGGGVQFLVNGIPQHPSLQKTLTVPEIARLNIPIEAIDRIEIVRGPMSVIYGSNAFLGVVNLVTNDIAAHGPRVSASLGSHGTGRLYGRWGKATRDGFFVLNAGGWGDDGLAGAYADMMSPTQLGALDPAMHPDMDGDMSQREGSLELSAGWRGLSADVRWTRRNYGFFALTPAFDEGTRIRLDTLHASLGFAHRFSDDLGLRVTGIHSQEHYDVYQLDFFAADLDGRQDQHSRRWELEASLHWQPSAALSTLFGYRLLHLEGVRNRPAIAPLIDDLSSMEPVTTHDLFAETGWRMSERLRLTTGARVTLLPGAYRTTRQDFQTGALTETTLRPQDPSPVTGRISLLWSPTRRQVVKLIWGTATQESDVQSVADPERIETLELNSTLTRPRWTLSGSLFQNETSNILRTIQMLDPVSGDYAPIHDNSGRWRTRGLELIAKARPLPELNLSASLTWQRTRDLENDIDPGYSPALLAKIKADWRRGPMTYAAYAHYVGAMEADWDFVTGPQPGIPERIGDAVSGYWNLGLSLRLNLSGTGTRANGPYCALNVSNLLDAEIRYPANELTDFDRGLIGPGRVVTFTLSHAF